MHLPPRQHRLDRDDAGQANANMRERPWSTLRPPSRENLTLDTRFGGRFSTQAVRKLPRSVARRKFFSIWSNLKTKSAGDGYPKKAI
jgi:hypothetical protein